MRHWIAGLVSYFIGPTTGLSACSRPGLEPLEDRSLPSTSMMMGMGMPMPPMNFPPMTMHVMTTPSTNMPSMGMDTLSHELNPNTIAAINQLFTDFEQTTQQVLASTTMQQFFTNEAHMIQVLAADLAQINMLGANMDNMM